MWICTDEGRVSTLLSQAVSVVDFKTCFATEALVQCVGRLI